MRKIRPSTVIINIFLGLLALCWLFPIIVSLFNSVKGRMEYNLGHFWDLPAENLFRANLEYIRTIGGITTGMMNSFLYSAIGAGGSILVAILAAYALTHLQIKHKLFWFLFIYSGTVFPFQMYLIPVFKGYSFIGLYDTRWGMMLFYIAICSPFCMFVLRNFFSGIPRELLESAKIDGATSLQILFRILAPMSVAPIAVLFFTQFSWGWNDLLFGLTFTKSNNIRPVMPALAMLGTHSVPAVFLACMLASIPTVILFSALQNKMQTGFVYQSK